MEKISAFLLAGLLLVGGAAASSHSGKLDEGLSYDYSAMILPVGGVDSTILQVSSNSTKTLHLRTELSSVDSKFTESDKASITYTVPPGGNRSFRIQVSPQVSDQGMKQLEVNTVNLNTSLEKSFELPVYIRKTSNTQDLGLPGISSLALILLFSMATGFLTWRKKVYS
ncbi:MAG: hypothetical protein ABEJ87_00170 [Candidatus Nanohalobium sp.]